MLKYQEPFCRIILHLFEKKRAYYSIYLLRNSTREKKLPDFCYFYHHNLTDFRLKKVAIIGAGFSSLSAACYIAQAGYSVEIFEKNKSIGGRARQFEKEGFKFDMGPTFYWMPDIFENFFSDFGKAVTEYYHIERLDPGYEIYFSPGQSIKQSAEIDRLRETFEQKECGAGDFLVKFLKQAEFNYRVAIDKVVYKPGKSPLELIMPETILRTPQFLTSLSYSVRRGIKDEQLRQMLEFPVLFLGAKPNKTPSFYRFMNYADCILGSWHVEGGMIEVINGMRHLAEQLGVTLHTDAPVEEIVTDGKRVKGVRVKGEFIPADAVLSGADYHHTEQLLPDSARNYTESYWDKKILAPSAILYYIGFNRRIDNVSHHTLFFDTSFDQHAAAIYDTPCWSEKPLFYASFPSKTDKSLAPEGKETAIILIPSAAGLEETPAIREQYFRQIIERIEIATGQELQNDILFHESFAMTDFMRDYNAYKGNAYGLANTLLQTAFLKPKIVNRHLRNLFYTGQMTVPGPGVPTALISGKIAATAAIDYLKSTTE